ncbi:Alpha/Beta hydrolase protein [Mycena vulgaris]|nr:Alpha/Beta hydrolase protein [Mycena vulgaris]
MTQFLGMLLSEDCKAHRAEPHFIVIHLLVRLTVNALTPKFPPLDSKLPVFVCFHGGNQRSGGFEIGDSLDTDTAPLLQRSVRLTEPIIVVTPDYCLNVFGFLAGREVARNGVGNLGFRDRTPQGLVPMQYRWPPGDASKSITGGQAEYDELVALTNCTHTADTLDCLRHAPFDALIFSNEWKSRIDDILLQNPYTSLFSGIHAKVPVLKELVQLVWLVMTDVADSYFKESSWSTVIQLGQAHPTFNEAWECVNGDLMFQGPRRLLLNGASKSQNAWGFGTLPRINTDLRRFPRFKCEGVVREEHGGFFAIDSLSQVNALDPNLQPSTSNPTPVFWPKWNPSHPPPILSFEVVAGWKS